jgi:uncharacterized coiled-coil DUF342 family protein
MASARRRAFDTIPETCDQVNKAAQKVESAVNEVFDTWVDFRAEEQDQRNKFRDALIEAYEEVDKLENRSTVLTDEISDLEREIVSLKEEIRLLNSKLEVA